jgi:hypothetical protein
MAARGQKQTRCSALVCLLSPAADMSATIYNRAQISFKVGMRR